MNFENKFIRCDPNIDFKTFQLIWDKMYELKYKFIGIQNSKDAFELIKKENRKILSLSSCKNQFNLYENENIKDQEISIESFLGYDPCELKKEDLIDGEIYLYHNVHIAIYPTGESVCKGVFTKNEKWEWNLSIKQATPEEKNWLNVCIALNTYVPYEESLKMTPESMVISKEKESKYDLSTTITRAINNNNPNIILTEHNITKDKLIEIIQEGPTKCSALHKHKLSGCEYLPCKQCKFSISTQLQDCLDWINQVDKPKTKSKMKYPEYVKCIKGNGNYEYNIVNKIYKVENYNPDTKEIIICGVEIDNINFKDNWDNSTDYKPSTKEAFDLQEKPKYVIGKWYKIGDWRAKFVKLEGYKFWGDTFITPHDGYKSLNTNSYVDLRDHSKPELMTDLSEIQSFLPENHPDKIKLMENKNNLVVHCKTQEQFDFVNEKEQKKLPSNCWNISKENTGIWLSKNGGFSRCEWYEEQGNKIISFETYLKENNYEMEKEDLTGRYVKALINKPQCIMPCKKGNYILLNKRFNENDYTGTFSYSAGWNIKPFDSSIWEIMPIGFNPNKIEPESVDFKIGDWVYFMGTDPNLVTSYWTVGKVDKIEDIVGNDYKFDIGKNRKDQFRLATKEEIESTQAKTFLSEDFILPEKWCIKFTDENKEVLIKWIKSHDNFDLGFKEMFEGWCISDKGWDNSYMNWSSSVPPNFSEITFDQFKKYVLKNSDKIEDSLIEEAKKRYPKGTYFYPAHLMKESTFDFSICISNGEFTIDEEDNIKVNITNPDTGIYAEPVVLHKNKWAEIRKEPKLEQKSESTMQKIKHKDRVTCKIGSIIIDDAVISIENGRVFICQNQKEGAKCRNKFGYNYSWITIEFVENNYVSKHDIDYFNIKLKAEKPIIIDDLGDEYDSIFKKQLTETKNKKSYTTSKINPVKKQESKPIKTESPIRKFKRVKVERI